MLGDATVEVEKEVEEVNNFHATPATRTSFFVSECYCADVGAGEKGGRRQKLTTDVPP